MNRKKLLDNLKKARAAARTGGRKTPLQVAAENPTSLRKAINAKCYDCNGGEQWVQRTRECPVKSCPLWNVRPHQK